MGGPKKEVRRNPISSRNQNHDPATERPFEAPEEGSGMAEEVAADSALLQPHDMAEEVAGKDSALLQSLLAALDVREFLAPEKKALEAACYRR
jgi:hypothetical protein